MKNLILFVTFLSSVSGLAASAPTIKYENLKTKQEQVYANKVEFDSVVNAPSSLSILNSTAIRLFIHGYSACGNEFLIEEKENDLLRIYQIGDMGPHAQPACKEVVEYFWMPIATWDDPIDKAVSKSLLIDAGTKYEYDSVGNLIGKKQKYIEVTVDAIRRSDDNTEFKNVNISSVQMK